MTDIEAIRERHALYAADPTIMRTDDDPQWCAECDIPWPCDTAVVLVALDEYERDSWFAEWRKARADADRLAECLDGHRECRMWGSTDDAVLRQHEETTR